MKDVTDFEWETVHFVDEYWDGPRNGIAEFRGVPHAFQCEWDDTVDDWSRVFRLSPINDGQLSAAKEAWSIWKRYQTKYHAGSLQADDTHPALAVDRERHGQIHDLVQSSLKVDDRISVMAIPEFRGSIYPGHDLEVKWFSNGNGS